MTHVAGADRRAAADHLAGADRLERAIRRATDSGRPALAAFLTAGFPEPKGFTELLRAVSDAAEVVEIGVPFSDPMADGVTIQESSRLALESGVTLGWILETVARARISTPVVLMSYLNPLLARGLAGFARQAAEVGVAGLIVPDLPYEECGPLRRALSGVGVALVQLVTPITPPERLRLLCAASEGFVYAVTTAGTTGGDTNPGARLRGYLDRVRALSPVPVLAGFGIRSVGQVREIAGHADGIIVGSALIEVLRRGEDPAAFLRGLRPTG